MKYSYKKNRLLQLRGFCAVIEEGSILKASYKMKTAQSNVSLQISSLERDLKVTLFKRENKRLIPTPEALRFYKISKKSIQDMDMIFENTIHTIRYDYENTIKIAAHSYMLSHILPYYFRKILEINPKVQFDIWNSSYEEAIDMLNNGLIDIAIYPFIKEKAQKNITAYEFYKCQFGIGVHESHPLAKIKDEEITWNMIAEHDYITVGKSITAQGLKSTIQDNKINSKFNLHNGTWEICAGIVKEGLSISGADVGYAKWHSDVIVKKCSSLMPDYQFHILINTDTCISQSSDQFIEILKS
jgi:DNA-binding transcriptional LysR family regulator